MPRLFDLLGSDSSKERLSSMGRVDRQAPRPRREPRQAAPAPAAQQPADVALRVPDFVAVDVETTGLNPRADRIIEVALVVFRAGQPAESFCSLVKPGVPIPETVTRLTGLADADVAAAPEFATLLERVVALIGRLPLCGHQIDFDASFLNEALKRAGRPVLDNLHLDSAALARTLLADLPGYSLSHVARALGIELTRAHRAPDDARACGLAAAALVPRLADLPVAVRRAMATFAPRSLLKKLLLDSLSSAAPPARAPEPLPRWDPLQPAPQPQSIDEEQAAAHFAADGGLARLVPGFSPRAGQTQMVRAVVQALCGNRLLAVEAGTGVGKSLAYLVPLAMYALANNRRVLVSTHTRTLQDQLATKDLPLVQRLLGERLRFSVLKGRANYLCRSRYRRLLAGDLVSLSPREREALLPLIRWAEQTRTGDIEEQRQFNRAWHGRVWSMVCAEADGCAAQRCGEREECFLHRARQRAQASHIVVINHALFYSDVLVESPVLGRLTPAVFDEAHHLEACGHRALCTVLDTNRVNNFLELCTSLCNRLERMAAQERAKQAASELKRSVRSVRHASEQLLAALAAWAGQRLPCPAEYQVALEPRALSALVQPGGADLALSELQDLLTALRRALDGGDERSAQLALDLGGCSSQVSQLRADMTYLCAADTPQHVFWLEGNREKGWVKACGVPLDIGSALAEVWRSTDVPAVFTSATLAVAARMEYFAQRVGLDGPNAGRSDSLQVPSPFAAGQALRAVLRGGPEPGAPGFAAWCSQAIAELYRALGRNMLVLFTANAMLREVERCLRDSNAVPRDKLLSQAAAASRSVLLTEFTAGRGTVLLGAASFWEGVDAPGEACEVVVIPRLPFQVPTDPLAQALAARAQERFGDSFRSYSVPEAAIRLRQGAGRLIRTMSDRGALVLLDHRVVSRSYGRLFADSLGGELRIFDDTTALCQTVTGFLAGTAEQAPAERLRYVPLDEDREPPDEPVA